ncbi:Asp-tRNA(Asn)/Glu-tRNA(Gln) amidotransferase subunit GatB [Candidatus Wolfebacteria bacterium]|nr:Asp-tRNA(Asn)/Glu-tRNA(Gln) amidotransferase subunit GatB [Candidatus Wolfebacteria bacterium]
MNYEPVIGLEIHAELKTRTKMFCGCLNDPDEKHPNINVCPVCLGHPGTLPVPNKSAIESVLKLGLTLDSKIPEESKFDRKNYFYPDLPKGYQISQYDQPLVLGGELNAVRITRIHLEEDTGRLVHEAYSMKHEAEKNVSGFGLHASSLVDFNRAGVPLMELVTEPDIKSGDETVRFAKELQLILRYLKISDADMEKGQMRVEVNISLGQIIDGKLQMGTKVEIKNLNSFKAVGDAIDYEIKRQAEVLEAGKEVVQETRGWNEGQGKTFSQRFKEESHDYRYFPEPDIPPMELSRELSRFNLDNLKIEIPELPAQKRKRFAEEYGLNEEQTEILVSDRRLAEFFEESVSELKSQLPITNYQLLINYLTSDLTGLMNQEGISISELKITPEHLAHLVAMIEKKELTSRMAKDVLAEMIATGLDPHEIIKEKGIAQVSDEDSIKKVIEEVIAENPVAIKDYKKGKQNALQFLIGKTMAKLKGQGNPEVIAKILNNKLR